MEPVVTKRLIIRRMASTDLLDFLTYHNHPEILRYMPVEPLTEEQAMGFLTRQAVVEIDDVSGYMAFAIQHIGDAKMIGEVGIYLSPKAQSKGDIGWSLHPSYQGHGYATEAAQVLLTYAFTHRKLHRINPVLGTQCENQYKKINHAPANAADRLTTFNARVSVVQIFRKTLLCNGMFGASKQAQDSFNSGENGHLTALANLHAAMTAAKDPNIPPAYGANDLKSIAIKKQQCK